MLPYLRRIENEAFINLSDEEKVETYVQMTKAQKAMMEDIIGYVEGKIMLSELKVGLTGDAIPDSDEENTDSTEGVEVNFDALDDKEKLGVRIIRGLTFAGNLALSPYLYEYSGMKNPTYEQYIETSPKLKYVMECIRTVKKYHEAKKQPISGQVIYMDRGVAYFDLIKEFKPSATFTKRSKIKNAKQQ